MGQALDELLQILEPERIAEGVFCGRSQDLGFGAVFGGQVLAQALSSAEQTVDQGRTVHSLHSYFLRPGDPTRSIDYEVEVTRDGGSFSTRRVRAVQHGRPIFFMAASFQEAEQGLSHQSAMPEVRGPDGVASYAEVTSRYKHLIPEAMRDKISYSGPIEMRPVQVIDPTNPQAAEPVRQIWLKAEGSMPDDPRVHRRLLAYASDFSFLATALFPHGRSYWQGNIKMATIDHAMWFHRQLRADEWLLYSMESPSTSNGRGLVRGQIFDRRKRLVASTIQEGLIREIGSDCRAAP
jgi:acyl-CoA thioesterase-2